MVVKLKKITPLLVLILLFIYSLIYPIKNENKKLIIFGGMESTGLICTEIKSKVVNVGSKSLSVITFSNNQKIQFNINDIIIPNYFVEEFPNYFYFDSSNRVISSSPLIQKGDSIFKRSGEHKFLLKRGEKIWELKIHQRFYDPCE